MNKKLIITIAIIVGVLLLAAIIYYLVTKPGKELKLEQTKQDIIKQKVENAPESRADLRNEIDKLKAERQPWVSASTNRSYDKPMTMGRPICFSGMYPPIPVGFYCKTAEGKKGTSILKEEAKSIVSYYDDLIYALDAKYKSLL